MFKNAWIVGVLTIVGLWFLSTVEDIYITWQFLNPKHGFKPLVVFSCLSGSSQLFILVCIGIVMIKSFLMWVR